MSCMGWAPSDRLKALQYPKEQNTAEPVNVDMQLPGMMFADSQGAHGKTDSVSSRGRQKTALR